MLREVETSKLDIGMYVTDLDRPWLDTPFPVQGFYIRHREDIDKLGEYCQWVLVDPRRFDFRLADQARRTTRGPDAEQARKLALPPKLVEYSDDTSVEDELPAAREALRDGSQQMKAMWESLTSKRLVRLEEVKSAIEPLVESVLRNKDALVALMRVLRADRHTHEHCIALAVWAGLLGRQMGLPPEEIKRLAMGCSLVDVGLARLPRSLLRKEIHRSPGDEAVYRSHVDFSLELLERMGVDDESLTQIVRWHHERMDGSGFPDGLSGGSIPVYARIAGIVDCYDSLISPRDESLTRSSFEALTELQDRCPVHFQAELMEQFARAVGIFPSGSLVELNTGEVGVVFSQTTGRRLRPKLILILDADQQKRDTFPIIDLSAPGEEALRISRELADGEYGIDAREYFL